MSAEATQIPPFIGRYQIIERVGSGGLGEVFKAIHPDSKKIVAVKRLHQKYQRSRKLLGLFHKEIMIQARVSHKHCLNFIEANLTPPDAHIVTDFIEGTNCHKLIAKYGPIPPIVACCIILDMLQGLEHLHCLDIMHSDLTPSNILVENTGRIVLADFGLSSDPSVEDYEGMNVGTPGYQAPERMKHEAVLPQTDIYCAGIILAEMLKGSHLFVGMNPKTMDSAMKGITFNWINTGHPKLTKLLAQTLSIALSYKAAKRFPTPRDFMYALYQCIKVTDINYPRRAILQWMVDRKITKQPPAKPIQKIYL